MLNFFKDLFQRQEQFNMPILRESLERTDEEKQSFEAWYVDKHRNYIMHYLNKQLDEFEAGENDIENMFILQSKKTNGFILKYNVVQYTEQEFQHLFDYFQTQVQSLGYLAYMSDVKNYARTDYVETIERHYLKPRFSWNEVTGISKQLYGNVLIERLLHNRKSIHIKLSCTSYVDRKWSAALDFKDLLKKIFV